MPVRNFGGRHVGQPVRPLAGLHTRPDGFLEQRLNHRKGIFGEALGLQMFEVFGGIHGRNVGPAALAHHLFVLGGELVHHYAAVLAVGDLHGDGTAAIAGPFDVGAVVFRGGQAGE